MSSVVYEAPNPSKGFNFFNFKPLKEGASSSLIKEVDQQSEKPSIKRENQVNLANPDQFNLARPNQVNLANPNQVNLANPDQVSFPSFFNSDAIEEELKHYQDQIEGEENGANQHLDIQKHVVPIRKKENSIDFDQVLIQSN